MSLLIAQMISRGERIIHQRASDALLWRSPETVRKITSTVRPDSNAIVPGSVRLELIGLTINPIIRSGLRMVHHMAKLKKLRVYMATLDFPIRTLFVLESYDNLSGC